VRRLEGGHVRVISISRHTHTNNSCALIICSLPCINLIRPLDCIDYRLMNVLTLLSTFPQSISSLRPKLHRLGNSVHLPFLPTPTAISTLHATCGNALSTSFTFRFAFVRHLAAVSISPRLVEFTHPPKQNSESSRHFVTPVTGQGHHQSL